ncbi:MAG: mechanosensitive ion channel domain-containing protein [Alphaproteobacteria bacterium]
MPVPALQNTNNASAADAGAAGHQRLQLLGERLSNFYHDARDAFLQFFDRVDASTPGELIAVAAAPVLAALIGVRLARFVRSRRKFGLTNWLSESAAPFFVPGLTLIFAMLGLAIVQASDVEPVLLPMEIKIAIAWLAMRLVLQMSSRQSAGWVIVLVIIPITLLHLFGVWMPLVTAMKGLSFTIGTTQLTALAVFRTVTLLALLLWGTNAILGLTERRLGRMKAMHVSNRVLIAKITQIVLYFIVFLIGLRILGVSLTALSVFSGAVGVGVGFGLQKIASNFISGIILLFEKSVEIGDFIALTDGTSGTVRATAARYTRLDLGDGREMLIPNEDLIGQRVINSTMSNTLSQQSLTVVIGYDVDPSTALPPMLEAAKSCKCVLKDPSPAAYVTAFGNYGVTLTLTFWLEDAHKSPAAPKSEVAVALWRAFRTHGIPIVTQQQFLHVGVTSSEPQGEPAAKPKARK